MAQAAPNSDTDSGRIRCLKGSLLSFGMILIVAAILYWTPYFSFSLQPDSSTFFPHTPSEEARIRKMIEEINNKNLSWTAEYNPMAGISTKYEAADTDMSSLKFDLFDLEMSIRFRLEADTQQHTRELDNTTMNIPDFFDAREHWPECRSVHQILNQGGCGSCWAAAAVSMMSDRLCISSNYTKQSIISIEDLLSCCDFCGGCTGTSYTLFPLLYMQMHGLVTGGGYGSSDGCRPYSIDSTCGAPCSPAYFNERNTPTCHRQCQRHYNKEYEEDLIKARSVYWLYASEDYEDDWYSRYALDALHDSKTTGPEFVKRDILLNGPAMLSMFVTEAFLHYKSGIYSDPGVETNLNLSYGHCMKLLGWGKNENGEEYWLVANSWGEKWGDNGYAKISMDTRGWEHFDITAATF